MRRLVSRPHFPIFFYSAFKVLKQETRSVYTRRTLSLLLSLPLPFLGVWAAIIYVRYTRAASMLLSKWDTVRRACV
jgi:hypothetical protein